MDSATLISVLSVAAFSSVGHCVGMCGGFVALLSQFLSGKSRVMSAAIIFGYNLARICAYILLGFIFGSFGGIFALSLRVRGYAFFIVGMFLVLLGVALIQRGSLLKFIEKNEFLAKILNKNMRTAASKKSIFGFLTLGFLNGLLPCGVVYYFLALAISCSSGAKGALVMALFGAVSLFAMSFYAFIFRAIGEKFKKFMLYASGVIIVAQGIYLAFTGFMATHG